MNNDEQKLQQHIDSIRFDDAADAGHRDKLEKQLLDAYETERKYADYQEPVAVYFRKLAIAACFLIGAGIIFWGIDSTFISSDPFAKHPEKEAIQEIIQKENVTGSEKKKLTIQIQDMWAMIRAKDTDGLVAAVNTPDTAYTVRKWAAEYLGKLGGEKTLEQIETHIHQLNITDPNNPLVIAANKIRERLDMPKLDISENAVHEPAGLEPGQ